MLDEVPCEIVHEMLEYVTASDLAMLRLVNSRLKVINPRETQIDSGCRRRFSTL